MKQHPWSDSCYDERADEIFDTVVMAAQMAGVSQEIVETPHGETPIDLGTPTIQQVGIRYIRPDASGEEDRHIFTFDSTTDEAVRMRAGREGWTLLEVIAFMFATDYTLNGVISVGIIYTDGASGAQHEIWRGFDPHL